MPPSIDPTQKPASTALTGFYTAKALNFSKSLWKHQRGGLFTYTYPTGRALPMVTEPVRRVFSIDDK